MRGLELLLHFAQNGQGVKEFYAKGKDTKESFTTCPEKIRAMYRDDKVFKILLNGFLVIDIDKHGVENGIAKLYEMFEPRLLPEPLRKINEYPCYATTPNNGYHLYFKYNGNEKLSNIDKTIEVKQGTITAPLIHRTGKPYTWHGLLDNAPPLYPILLSKMPRKRAYKGTVSSPQATQSQYEYKTINATSNASNKPYIEYPRMKKTRLSIEQCIDYAIQDNPTLGNHDLILAMAIRARNEGYTQSEIITAIENTSTHQSRNNKDDTFSCIESIF